MTAALATPTYGAVGGNPIVSAAMSQIGKPYRWARPLSWRTGDPSGFDCSGLVGWSVYQGAGKTLPHQSAAMYAMVLAGRVFSKIPVGEAGPGDVVFFGRPVHHCGIAVGNGQMVEAPTYGIPVRTSQIADNPASLRPYAGRIAVAGGAAASVPGLSGEQAANAGIIASVGAQLGATVRDIAVAIMAALDESGLRNLSGGDRDSAGLFQQRPSQGWGSWSQVTDPVYASRSFFDRLLALPGRDSEDPWMEAQDVQHSADPTGSNYEAFWNQAQSITGALSTGADRLGYGGLQGVTGGIQTTAVQTGIDWNPLNWGSDIMHGVAAVVLKGVFVVGGIVLVVLGAKNATTK